MTGKAMNWSRLASRHRMRQIRDGQHPIYEAAPGDQIKPVRPAGRRTGSAIIQSDNNGGDE